MMSEKENFLTSWDKEFQTTMRVLKSFPPSRQDYRPHEKSRSAKELAWTFVLEEKTGINGSITGQINFPNTPPPATMKDVLAEFERNHKENLNKIKNMSEEELNKTMKFPVAPKKMADVRRMDVLWFTLMDMIHHRGQFSVYLRLVSAKVPSIYGPTADEPWM
ncbi:DinB family protein [Candidatus Woesearchaeota archaeon]|nr:DinB family protein [Candidatus Woesearchaeota archaeon]